MATNAATGWTATIELDVLQPLEKGSRARKTVVIQNDSVNFNFGRCRVSVDLLDTAFTINFHMLLSHSLFTWSIDTACTVQVHVEYTVYPFNMYFVCYNVTTCTNISYSNMHMYEALSALFVSLVVIWQYIGMHGQMHPNYCQITILLAHVPLSSSAYIMMIHPSPRRQFALKLWLLNNCQQSIVRVKWALYKQFN